MEKASYAYNSPSQNRERFNMIPKWNNSRYSHLSLEGEPAIYRQDTAGQVPIARVAKVRKLQLGLPTPDQLVDRRAPSHVRECDRQTTGAIVQSQTPGIGLALCSSDNIDFG